MIILAKQKKIDLFYTIKVNTSDIISNNYFIKSSFDLFRKNGNIVSLGDNQVFKFIRRLKEKEFNREYVNELFERRNHFKSLDKNKKNGDIIHQIQNEINEYLFVSDIVSVKCNTTRKDYKDICKNGFSISVEINNKVIITKYKRLCAGAGQLRRNTAIFVNEDLYDSLETIMMCGLTKNKIGKINLAKFNAYFSLYTSSTNKVKTPRICVIKDFEYTLKNQNVVWISENDNGELYTENKNIDMDINAFDGSGMISPEMAKIWQDNLSLDYLPASFIIRSAWIKGLVSIFDFKKFSKEVAKKDTIVDLWGKEHNVNDIDVILTSSQFKLYKKYSSWDEYMYYYKKYGHMFGVTRVTKKENNFMTTLNYQYIQTNNFTDDSIKSLANYTVDWLKKIMLGDKLFTILLLSGVQDSDCNIKKIENNTESNIAKAIMYNSNILNDIYIRKKIDKMIEKKIKQAKIGKLYVEGSYDFTIPDLYAMAEYAFGLEPKGLLSAGECWNKRWVDKGSPTVTLMRSPLVAPGENRKLNINFSDKCKDWFKYIYSGNIYNIWDTTIIAQSDADFDGDLSLVSDNKYLLDAVDGNLPIVTYEKKKAKEQRINLTNFASMDTKSFDSKIGQITNLASTLISMLSDFSKNSEEYKEIRKRIDLLRRFQGDAIDATKGMVFVPPPKEWSKRQKYIKVPENSTTEDIEKINKQNKKISFNNRICANVKPYFFGYVYDKEMKEYNAHKKKYNIYSQKMLNKKFSDILDSNDNTEIELKLKKNYYKYSPLKRNKCIMNILTYYFEDIIFDNKWKYKNGSFNYKILMHNENYVPSKKNINFIEKEFKDFFREYQSIINTERRFEYYLEEEYSYENIFHNLFDILEDSLFSLISNEEELCDCVIYVLYNRYEKYNKDFLWDCFGEQILKNIKSKSNKCCIVCKNDDGVEYMGQKYSIVEVDTDAII